MNHYKIKSKPEDFFVQEILMLPTNPKECGKKIYTYYTLEKKNITTIEAIDLIANHLGLNSNKIGYAGLKDEDAVSKQNISIEGQIPTEKIAAINSAHSNGEHKISLSKIGRGNKPIKTSELLGNSFKIVIRNFKKDFVNNICKKRIDLRFMNYYGKQRFGLPNQSLNTHKIGAAIIEQNYEIATLELAKQNSHEGNLAKKIGGNYRDFFNNLNPQLVSLFQSAYYSALWNLKLSNELANSSIPNELHADQGIHISLPKKPQHLIMLLQKTSTIQNTRITYTGDAYKKTTYPRPKIIQTQIHVINIGKDELYEDRYKLQIMFALPLGSYATIAIHQFMSEICDAGEF